jgi:hypothetical protein
MKKLIMLLILIPFMGLGQLEFKEKKDPVTIGEVKVAGTFYGSTMYLESHDVYVIFFRNLKYQHIKDIKNFTIGNKEDLNSLYDIIIKNIVNKSKHSLELDKGKGKVLRLEFAKKQVQFWYYDGVSWSLSLYFNEKQINQLFGN